MSDEVKAMLFDAFFTTKKTGMGIGLNICRTIVENHHGRLLVSDTEGGGTTFTVRIPVNMPEGDAGKTAAT
jgi:signal transduction histidine kinase